MNPNNLDNFDQGLYPGYGPSLQPNCQADTIRQDVEQFLADGGKITVIPPYISKTNQTFARKDAQWSQSNMGMWWNGRTWPEKEQEHNHPWVKGGDFAKTENRAAVNAEFKRRGKEK